MFDLDQLQTAASSSSSSFFLNISSFHITHPVTQVLTIAILGFNSVLCFNVAELGAILCYLFEAHFGSSC